MTSTAGLVSAPGLSVGALIMTDVLGRLHRTREQRERILHEYERSGLNGPKFAALCGVKYRTFASYISRSILRSPVVHIPLSTVTLPVTPDTVPDTVLLAKSKMNIVNVTDGTGFSPLEVSSSV